ncbi:MAG: hypothetical protein RLZZ511_2896 [Cyanobacteriota bacterium]|jgi:nitroimidazol reductase NimA-like FMN-containing flavoprotein (pyridoxamine 5'-phosphate oxidase superfamily)
MSQLATAMNGWINTAEAANGDRLAQAVEILRQNRFCTLATVSSDGWPWASPLLYGYDQQLMLYWSSAIAARHSIDLANHQGRCALTVYDSQASPGKVAGLFFQGVAQLVPETQVTQAMQHLFARVVNPPDRTAADYLGESPRRFYQFQPQQIWISGARVPVGNQLVDTKIQLDQTALLQYLVNA